MDYYLSANPSPNNPQTVDFFCGDIAPCEHTVQFYEADEMLLDTLEGFVVGGLQRSDNVILIATPAHLQALETRMVIRGLDLEEAHKEGRYFAYDAQMILSQFMENGWPNQHLFMRAIIPILTRARKNGRPVRVFGEMVALLWAQGNGAATVKLEHLWHELCQNNDDFSIFCAYPKVEITVDARTSFAKICESHTMVFNN